MTHGTIAGAVGTEQLHYDRSETWRWCIKTTIASMAGRSNFN
jgi:hypothetical protein